MSKKFVQIAAFSLALLLLSTPMVGAEPNEETDTEIVEEMTWENPGEELTDTEPGESETEDFESDENETADSEVVEDEPVDPEPVTAETANEPYTGTSADEKVVRVGLFYNTTSLPGANLLNSVGSGYRFGYDNGTEFCKIGYTYEKGISVVKSKNVYYTRLNDGLSGYTDQGTSSIAVGCYHIGMPGSYATFEEAKAAAASVGGFPAWIKGQFQVRIGTYTSKDAAESAIRKKGLSNASVVGTSSSGITVVITGTDAPVFQFDGGSENPMLIVKPGVDDSVKTITHFKKKQYYGSFCYERINGGDLTVVNMVIMDDYVRGILPYEMSPSWPIEALKAQAVCARSYTIANMEANRHSSNHFDICTTTHCQVYSGTGSANANTDQAVEETLGQYAWYDGKIIEAYYHSSDGGATESIENVWNEYLPYLRGVEDPYEGLVESKISNYYWTKTYTGKELQQRFSSYGYVCAEIVDIKVSKLSDTGNVLSVSFTDKKGKTWTVSKDNLVRSMMGVKSLRYTIVPGGDGYSLTDDQHLGVLNGAWALDENGDLIQINQTTVYALTGDGVQEVEAPENTDGTFNFVGTGSGHNLGLSQWGAYSMALQGMTYDEILKFYYTGIEIYE